MKEEHNMGRSEEVKRQRLRDSLKVKDERKERRLLKVAQKNDTTLPRKYQHDMQPRVFQHFNKTNVTNTDKKLVN